MVPVTRKGKCIDARASMRRSAMSTMNRLLVVCLALFWATMSIMSCKSNGGGSSSQTPQAAGITRHAFLTDKLVVSDTPPVSSATGTAAVTLDTATGKLTGTVTLANLTNAATSVHINDGDVGSNGAPIVSLVETPAGSGTWTIPDTAVLNAAQQDRFKAAGLYV